ncbi:hypothetical protein DDF62_03370 [Caulobacter radicis]|uniref:hypothetical protein n=1 Tax=Caulobacter radicis TaxID=2172650 RepID=UPI000D584038|nr:hypothetical protein [Caulobacter radicis]PVM92203.1 hypothetical protein DDF62_03370 [Caulobacter radicis]
MDWFDRLVGFAESDYATTQARLRIEDGRLGSDAVDATWRVGTLELPSLAKLRERAAAVSAPGRLSVQVVRGDARALHNRADNADALFQVASQFNLLEMVDPGVSPEDGVGRYDWDPTQGPACAIAAGAATIYRNYLAPVGGQAGQTRHRQFDALAGLGARLADLTGRPIDALWSMRNGYALCADSGLEAIAAVLDYLEADQIDSLRGLLRVGLVWDAEVTDAPERPGQTVCQAFCSALPVSYAPVTKALAAPFAGLILEAAYEATLLAGRLNAARGHRVIYLTRLGGGAFGNATAWIDAAMVRALDAVRDQALDVRIVSYAAPDQALLDLAARYA